MPAAEVPVSHSLVKALRCVPAFEPLPDEALLRVVGASSNLVWKSGSPIFHQGTPGDGLYIVLSGRVRIYDESDPAADVNSLGPGDYFGELSLLLDRDRSMCTEAVEDTELLVLPKSCFDSVLAETPELEADVRAKLEERLPAS